MGVIAYLAPPQLHVLKKSPWMKDNFMSERRYQ